MDQIPIEQTYIPLDEAVKLLGTNQGRFFYYVDAGPIAKAPGSGKRNARYSVEDILKVKEKIGKKQKKHQESDIVVDWIGIDDVLTSLQLDYRVYGPKVFFADLSYYAERVKRNPHVALAVFDTPKRERIFAYISLLPLPETTIVDILQGNRHETDITNQEIETYDKDGEYTLLAESVVIDPEHPEALNTLLRHMAEYWCTQYPKRSISKIYAQAESDQGDILIQKLFLAPLENLAPNAYMLNMKRPGASRFIRRFQECIKNKCENEND
jgi:hypothetical protein